jgi:hypothetical protein
LFRTGPDDRQEEKAMESNASKTGRGARVAAVLSLGPLLTTSGNTVLARSDDSLSHARLTGTWAIQVTLRDCATDAPLGPSFNSLVTFHRGGTLNESTASLAFAAGQRSSAHGAWAHQHGRTYEQRMVALILFDTQPNLPGTPGFDPTAPVTPGFFAGWQTVTHTVRLSDADHFTSSGTNAFYKTNGDVYRTGCSTATAERFE